MNDIKKLLTELQTIEFKTKSINKGYYDFEPMVNFVASQIRGREFDKFKNEIDSSNLLRYEKEAMIKVKRKEIIEAEKIGYYSTEKYTLSHYYSYAYKNNLKILMSDAELNCRLLSSSDKMAIKRQFEKIEKNISDWIIKVRDYKKEFDSIDKSSFPFLFLNRYWTLIFKSVEKYFIVECGGKGLYCPLIKDFVFQCEAIAETRLTIINTFLVMLDSIEDSSGTNGIDENQITKFNGMSYKDVKEHFSELANRKTKKGHTFLTTEQLNIFLETCLLKGETLTKKIKPFIQHGEFYSFQNVFHSFYHNSAQHEETLKTREKYFKLMVDNFSGIENRNIKHFADKPKKTK